MLIVCVPRLVCRVDIFDSEHPAQAIDDWFVNFRRKKAQ